MSVANAPTASPGAGSEPSTDTCTSTTDACTRAHLEQLLGDTFSTFRREAFAYCFSIVKDACLAEDAVQVAFTELQRRIRNGDASFFAAGPWEAVKRNLRWAALKQRRDAGQCERWFTSFDVDLTVSNDTFSAVEQRLVVDGILAQLPAHMRQVLHLRTIDDAPDAVSAARLGISLDAFRCRYKRAVAAARAAARGLGVEGTAGAMVIGLQRRWIGFRARLARTAGRGTTAVARVFETMADSLVRTPSLGALGAVAMAALAGGGPAVSTPAMAAAAAAPPGVVRGSPPQRVAEVDRAPRTQGVAEQSGLQGIASRAFSALPALPGSTRQASDETPDDTKFFTATSPSDPGYSSWIVALGWGRACSCAVVFQSRDGGASWTPAAGPPGDTGSGERITLPPGYPADPRVFLSSPSQEAPSYTASRFGAPFIPLPVPSGGIALDPGYDSNGHRLFVAGAANVWTYSLDTGLLSPVLLPGAVTRVADIAAPPQPGGPVLFVAADVTVPGAGLTGQRGTQPTLFRCGTPTACSPVSTLALTDVASLRLSPHFALDQTLEAAWYDAVAVSHDGGRTFALDTVHSGGQTIVSSFLSTGPTLWAVVRAGDVISLVRGGAGGNWLTALQLPPDASASALMDATTSANRILVLPTAGGLLCSADGGATWARRCPSA